MFLYECVKFLKHNFYVKFYTLIFTADVKVDEVSPVWVLVPTLFCTFCQASFSSCGLAEDRGTADTQHYSLSVTEHCCDLVASCKQRIHKNHLTGHNETATETSSCQTLYNRYKIRQSLDHWCCPCSCLCEGAT